MITVISGEPGNGKTAYVVSELQGEIAKGRQVFVFGIPELNLAVQRTPPVATWTELVPHDDDSSIMVPRFTFPSGALIVIDEAQDVYPPRSSGSKVPAIAAALERHRHQGLDLWLITQKPLLLDSHVRQEAGRHLHIVANWKGRQLLEWPSVRNPGDRSEVARAISRPYKLPSKVFGLYKSASLHVEVKRRLPVQLYAFVIMVLGSVVATGFVAYRVQARVSPEKAVIAVREPVAATVAQPRAVPPAQARAEARMRLVSYVFARRADTVLHRYWIAEQSSGQRVRVDGSRCAGEGRAAVCTWEGQVLSF